MFLSITVLMLKYPVVTVLKLNSYVDFFMAYIPITGYDLYVSCDSGQECLCRNVMLVFE
jgi:hypothetical protein